MTRDSIKDVSKLIANFKHILTEDKAAACVALREVGVPQKSSRVQFPLVEELWKYPAMELLRLRHS